MTRLLDLFRRTSCRTEALRELEEAQRDLLAAQTQLDYFRSIVGYHKERIKRLTAYVAKEPK